MGPCVDLTSEHGQVLELDPAHVVGFCCDSSGGVEDKPCRPFVMTSGGLRYQLGEWADEPEANAAIDAVKAKLWPAP